MLTYEELLDELVKHIEECVNLYLEFYVQGCLQEIKLLYHDEEATIKVIIDGVEHEISVGEYRWGGNTEDERERFKECYHADGIWYEFFEETDGHSAEESLEKACEMLSGTFSDVEVRYFVI